MTMPIKNIDNYEVEFTGELHAGTEHRGSFVAIFAPSDNPTHLNNIYPTQRLSADLTLLDQHAAEAEAERAAAIILDGLRS
jgi:hypothetical protein